MMMKKIAPYRSLTLFTLLAVTILPATAQSPATQTPAQKPAQAQTHSRRRRGAPKPPPPVKECATSCIAPAAEDLRSSATSRFRAKTLRPAVASSFARAVAAVGALRA